MPTLDTLKQRGERGRILDILGDDGIAIRLMEMGLTEGEEISLLGFAPLGDPIEYEIRGYRISLRKSEAQRVEIEPLP
jgi:ferrous iron transport protein A